MIAMTGLFSTSSQLRDAVSAVRKKVQNELGKSISLVEYITLPDFGQHIILRFELDPTPRTLAKIDFWESKLRNLVGRDLWVTLSGCYKDIYPPGIFSELSDRLVRLSPMLVNIPVPVSTSKYAELIRQDADVIRAAIQNWQCEIWEIEIPAKEKLLPIIRIIGEGDDRPPSIIIGAQKFEIEYYPENDSYENLLKAYKLSSQSGLSLVHYIVENSDNVS
jgi:hypothetical protein